tara:strand:+ start:13 stop:543 length:531 start_codon:yes stop_codon:yes gene_type:complete
MAGQRLTDKTALAEQTGSGDLYMVVDVSDTTGSSAGTSKSIDSKFVIQTDKFSLSNAEVKALHTSSKTLVGALSGYMVTPLSCTVLCTADAGDLETSNKNLYLGYEPISTTNYWAYSSRFMGSQSTDNTYIFQSANKAPTENSTILNKGFYMYSNGAFTGGWTCDVYLTYCYTKLL